MDNLVDVVLGDKQSLQRMLIKNMADQVEDKRLEGISDIRDETDRNGMRIVLRGQQLVKVGDAFLQLLILSLQLLPVQPLEGDEPHVADGLGLDETDRNGMRIVIELKRDANPQVVLNRLFAQTQLQTTFAINAACRRWPGPGRRPAQTAPSAGPWRCRSCCG